MASKETFPLSKPGEELAYWGIFRGQKVSLLRMHEQAPLSALAAEVLVENGEGAGEAVYDARGRKIDTLVFIPELVAKYQDQQRIRKQDGSI